MNETKPDEFIQAENRLRKAVAAGSFEEAQDALSEFRRRLDEGLASLPSGDPRAASLARKALEVLEWARRMVLAARAHSGMRMARLRRRPRAYGAAAAAPQHTWKLQG